MTNKLKETAALGVELWNDSCAKNELEDAVAHGFVGATSNPVIVGAAVNQDKASKTREAFTKTVLGKSTAAVESYWQQQIFAGKDVPPAEKASDADVIAFVKSNPGGVGYVSGGAALPADVKAIAISGS